MYLDIPSVNTHVVIPLEKQDDALASLVEVADPCLLPQPQSLDQLIRWGWGWQTRTNKATGAINALSYSGEDAHMGASNSLFRSLAPYVTPGGYVVARLQGEVRELHFNGKHVVSITYDLPHTMFDLEQLRTAALGRLKKSIRASIRTHAAIVPNFRTDHYEARDWLGENLNFRCFALGNKDETLRYVERLYTLGARQVCVVHVFDRLCDTLLLQGPYADTLAIELPPALEEAQTIRDFCQRHRFEGRAELIEHECEFWHDAIPEGWIGVRWD